MISTSPEPRRSLIVSFHDVHPGSRAVCDQFIAALAARGIPRVSLLVVPRWHGALPISEDRECVAWLQDLAAHGHDICLHGYFHQAQDVHGGPVAQLIGRHYTQSEGEYFQISYADAAERVRLGLDILTRDARLPVTGFTAPAWLLSAEARRALVEAGLAYSTTFAGIDLLQRGKFIPAPTIVYSCRNAWRRAVSRAWVRFWQWRNRSAAILRVAAHPGDFSDAKVTASLYRRLDVALAAGRVPVTYADVAASLPALAV